MDYRCAYIDDKSRKVGFDLFTGGCPDAESKPEFIGSNVSMFLRVPRQSMRALILQDIYCYRIPDSTTILSYLNVKSGDDVNFNDGGNEMTPHLEGTRYTSYVVVLADHVTILTDKV